MSNNQKNLFASFIPISSFSDVGTVYHLDSKLTSLGEQAHHIRCLSVYPMIQTAVIGAVHGPALCTITQPSPASMVAQTHRTQRVAMHIDNNGLIPYSG